MATSSYLSRKVINHSFPTYVWIQNTNIAQHEYREFLPLLQYKVKYLKEIFFIDRELGKTSEKLISHLDHTPILYVYLQWWKKLLFYKLIQADTSLFISPVDLTVVNMP